MQRLPGVERRLLSPSLGMLVVLVCVQVLSVRADDTYGSYLVRSRQISDLSEGLEIMSQFRSPKASSEVRCKKYALVLSGFYKDQSMDQFQLAKMGQDSNVDMNAFRRITMDMLRDLYIAAIDRLIEEHLGEPCMELIGCLNDIFYNRDAKARAYLNRKQLKRITDQYSSIASQSISFLLDDEMRHPSLSWNQLERPVQLAAVRLFMGNEERARAHFTSPREDTSNRGFMEDKREQVVEQKQQQQQQQHQMQEKQSMPTEQMIPLREASNAEHLAKDLVNGFYTDSERLTKQLPEDYRKLMEQLNNWLHLLHHSLPLRARLSDRCRAYSKLMAAEPSQLGLTLVEQILKQTDESVSANQQAADTRFLPDANMRENFLFTISVYPRNNVEDGLWMNLIDCVSLWKDDDERVRQFMTNSRQFLYSQLDPFINHRQPAPAHKPASPAPKAAAI